MNMKHLNNKIYRVIEYHIESKIILSKLSKKIKEYFLQHSWIVKNNLIFGIILIFTHLFISYKKIKAAPEIATTGNGHAADPKSNGNDKPTVKIAEIVKLPVEIAKQTKLTGVSSTNGNEISQIPNFSRILPNNRSKIAKYQTSSKNVLPCRNLSLGGIVVCKTVSDEEKILFSLNQIASSATKKSDSGSLKDSTEKNYAAENSATKSSESTAKPPVSFEFNPDQLEWFLNFFTNYTLEIWFGNITNDFLEYLCVIVNNFNENLDDWYFYAGNVW